MPERNRWYETDDWNAKTPLAALKRGILAAWKAVLAITGDASIADDMSQQGALETMDGKRPSHYNDADHVRHTVRFLAVCRTLSLRRGLPLVALDPEYVQDDRTLSPEERAELMEARTIFRAAVEALPEKQGLVIKARLRGDSLRKIAADLGISYATARRRMIAAAAAILRELDRAEVDPSWWNFGIGAMDFEDDDPQDSGHEDLPPPPDFDADGDDKT